MAGAVHLVDQGSTATPRPSRLAAWLETAVFVCLAAVALCAPLATKGAVNAFRAASLLWLILLCTRKRKLFPQPLAVPLIFFLVLTGFSTAFSIDPFLSWGRMRTISLLFLATVAGQTIRSLRQLKIVAALLIGSCLLTVIYTGWQYTAGIGVQAVGTRAAVAPLQRFGLAHGEIIRKLGPTTIRSPRDLFSRRFPQNQADLLILRETPNALRPFHLNVDPHALQQVLQGPGITLSRAHPPRAQGFFKHYFPFSEILVFVALLMLGFLISGVPPGPLRLGLVAGLLATGITLVLTLTRISMVSLLVGGLIVALWRGKDWRRGITIAGFLIIVLTGTYWVQQHRSTPGSDPGTEYRLLMWRDSISLIRAHPIFGVGLDAVAGDWQRWNLEAYRRFGLHSHFHSTPVQLAVECGLPALAVWIWLLAAYAIFLVRLHRAAVNSDWFARGLVLGAFGGLAAFILTGFLQYNLGDAEAMVVFWLLMGLTFALHRLVTELPSREVSARHEVSPAPSGV